MAYSRIHFTILPTRRMTTNDDKNTLSRRGPPRARATLHHLDGPRRVVRASWPRTATDTPLEWSASPMADGRRRRYLYASGPGRCSANMLRRSIAHNCQMPNQTYAGTT